MRVRTLLSGSKYTNIFATLILHHRSIRWDKDFIYLGERTRPYANYGRRSLPSPTLPPTQTLWTGSVDGRIEGLGQHAGAASSPRDEDEDEVSEGHPPDTEIPTLYRYIYQVHSSYLGGRSVHVCTLLYTHVYTIVYLRVHYHALGMSSVGLSQRPHPRG